MVKSPSIRKTIQLLAVLYIVPFYNTLHLIIFTPFGNGAESQAVYTQEIPHQSQTDTDDDIPTCMVFLHIPKSGGRSVASFLTAVTDTFNFTQQRIYGAENVHLQPSDLSVNRTFTLGHFTTRLFDEQPAFRKCFTITVLREPVDRAISAFYFHKHRNGQIEGCLQVAASSTNNNNNTQFKQKYRGKKICRSNWQYSNDMTRRLAGGSLHGMSWNTRAGSRFTKPIPNASHVHDAKWQLRLFDLVCFTHDLSKCADGVLRAFRLSRESQHNDDERIQVSLEHMSPKVDPRWKTINRPDKLEESAMEKFREVNDLDIELYDWAIEKFS